MTSASEGSSGRQIHEANASGEPRQDVSEVLARIASLTRANWADAAELNAKK